MPFWEYGMKECNETDLIHLFVKEPVEQYEIIDSSQGEEDFRETIIATLESGNKLVVKVSSNAFTTSESIKVWQRCAEEYRSLGYYCPQIYPSLMQEFPAVDYKGLHCIAYADEFSPYQSVHQSSVVKPFRDELYAMTARVAAKRFDYASIPSGYCLFDLFPGEQMDEVTENAGAFLEYCKSLPPQFEEQWKRIYARWETNRRELKEIYYQLPFSVFQADFNDTNVLVDDEGNFVGIYDFNLAGRDEILNYLFREIYDGTFEEERQEILHALKIASQYYFFSDLEIKAAPLIYRCVKPLWYSRVQELKKAGGDLTRIKVCLNEMEHAQTCEIDFESVMR